MSSGGTYTLAAAHESPRCGHPSEGSQNKEVLDESMPGITTGGEGGIRTPGGVTHARFPGVCLKPLSHLSNRITAKI